MEVNAKNYKYAVVKFLQRPCDDIDAFVCIPHSWIRIRRATEKRSIVAYPSEQPSVTQRRIKDGEIPSEKWSLYMAVVKLETYTYKDAYNYALEKKYGIAADNLCSSLGNGRNRPMKRSQPMGSELNLIMDKLRVIEATNQGPFFENKISHAAEITDNLPTKNQGFVYPYIQKIPDFCEDKSAENDSEEIVRKPCYISRDLLNSMKQHLIESQRLNNQNQASEVHQVQEASQVLPTEMVPEQSLELSNKSPQLLLNDRPQGSSVRPMIEPEASPVNNAAQSVTEDTVDMSLKLDDESDRSCSSRVSTEEDQPLDYPTKRVRAQANFMVHLLDKMKTSYLHSSERISEVHKSFDYSIELLERIEKTYNHEKLKGNEKKQAEVEEIHDVETKKDGNVKNSSNADDDKDDSEDDDEKAPKSNRDCLRKFVLPPEYDAKDSRWTLKYRNNDPTLSLVELVPGSNVLVNSIKLAHCKRVSKDCKTFARMLLAEIFSQNALAVCSLTGARANAFHNNGTYIRPGLDANARMTMFAYVEDYAREKQWAAFDKQSVINSIRSRIQEIRSKYARK